MMSNRDGSHYVLEGPEEAERLERQASLPGYRIEEELATVELAPWSYALDAGCGTGIGARHLAAAFPGRRVEGCDQSPIRLAIARRLTDETGTDSIDYFESDLSNVERADASFDLILCRYVLEHVESPNLVAGELRRLLRPGGQLVAIDLDGVLVNLRGASDALRAQLDLLNESSKVDLHFGHKLPSTLEAAGFEDIRCSIHVVEFEGELLVSEQQLCETRLRLAHPWLSETLGGTCQANAFIESYIHTLGLPTSTLHYDKYIVSASRGPDPQRQ